MSRLVISQKLINEAKSSTTTFINKDSNTFVHFTDTDTKHKTSNSLSPLTAYSIQKLLISI